MENSYNVKWSKEFEEKMLKDYKYAKKVYMEANSENKILNKIQDIINQEKINNNDDFIKMIDEYKIFKFDEKIDFVIKSVNFKMENDNGIVIEDCAIIFLSKVDDLNNFKSDTSSPKLSTKLQVYDKELINSIVEKICRNYYNEIEQWESKNNVIIKDELYQSGKDAIDKVLEKNKHDSNYDITKEDKLTWFLRQAMVKRLIELNVISNKM